MVTNYTKEQIDIALGILSGRINPELDLRFFVDAQKLHGNEIRSVAEGGTGNPGIDAHRRKAEEILLALLEDKATQVKPKSSEVETIPMVNNKGVTIHIPANATIPELLKMGFSGFKLLPKGAPIPDNWYASTDTDPSHPDKL